ncbi:MAG: hypothetical protein H6978_11750 [Gammaproteobacteria bacterium]|nr:hypothetical protein [Gammaproteobacteria bacterium]
MEKVRTRFAVVPAPSMEGVIWSTTYTATRTRLVNAGLATPSQFPKAAKARSSSNGAHPESGRWYLWQEDPQTDTWAVTYYGSFLPELSTSELYQLAAYLRRQDTLARDTIDTIIVRWGQAQQRGDSSAAADNDRLNKRV